MASQQEEPSIIGDESSGDALAVPVNDDEEEEQPDVFDIYEFNYGGSESEDDHDAYAADQDIYDFQYDDGDDDGSASKEEQERDFDDDKKIGAEDTRDEKTEEERSAEEDDGSANSPLVAESKQGQESDGHSTIESTPLRSAESKRGGRLDTKGLGGLSSWQRLLGKGQITHKVGDLVEAEWNGSGWWFVGYVESIEETEGNDKKGKGIHHVVFADGDRMDIQGRFLRQLGPPGHTNGSAGTLARHVPIADLGSGRLHRDLEPADLTGKNKNNNDKSLSDKEGKSHMDKNGKRQRGRRSKNSERQESSSSLQQQSSARENSYGGGSLSGRSLSNRHTDESGSYSDRYTEDGVGRDTGEENSSDVLERSGSWGNIEKRREQGRKALWGGNFKRGSLFGRRKKSESTVTSEGGEIFRWWETGTQYAFQPRLAAKPSTTISERLNSAEHGRRGSNDSWTKSGGEGGGSRTHRGGQGRGWGRDDKAGVCRVAQPVEGHPERGTRVFFIV